MENELNQTTTSRISGDKKNASTATNGESEKYPKNGIKPRQRKPARRWLGLPKSKWRELFGIFLLIPWVWNEIIDTHGFLRLSCLAACLAISQGIVCSFWGINKKTVCIWVTTLLPVAGVFWLNSQPPKTDDFELLSPAEVSSLTKILNNEDSHIKPTAILIHAVNPDESAFALCEQLKSIFHDGKFVVVEGSLPEDTPEIPGVSCFMYGYAAANAGLWRAAEIILKATGGHSEISMLPRYTGKFIAISQINSRHKQDIYSIMSDFRSQFRQTSDPDFTNSVMLILIRKK